MKKNIKYLLFSTLVTCLFAGLASCVEEPLWLDGNNSQEKGVKITFSLTLPEPKKIETRGNVDDALNSVYLLVFDKDEKFVEWTRANENSDDTYNFVATLTEQSQECSIYVVANVPILMGTPESPSTTVAGWIPQVTTLEEVKNTLIKATLVTGSEEFIRMEKVPETPPMICESPIKGRIQKSMTIDNVIMIRVMAKVTVNVSNSLENFIVKGATICNAPVRGYIFPEMTLSGPDANVKDYYGESSGTYSLGEMPRTGSENQPLYCYESIAENGTFAIIYATYNDIDGYYKIDLKDAAGNQFALQRNYWYRININKVQTPGYRTAEEARINTALNNLPGNDVIIDGTDVYSHDIVSNGAQYLGVSNSELVVYQTGEAFIEAVKLSYTVAGGWNPGTIGHSSGITIVGNTTLNNANTKDQSINVRLAPNFTSGTITFRIGNLYKVVKITKQPSISAVAEQLEFDNISVADKSADNNNTKIAFSTVDGVYTPESHTTHRLFFEDGKKLYVRVNPNVGYNTAGTGAKREGEFYLAHSNSDGRIKVHYQQDYMDVYTGKVQIKPYTYVATFHRHNETAERIIRIKVVNPEKDQTWMAVVVAGEEWIELDDSPSNDTGITKFPYGYDETQYPVGTGPLSSPLTPDGIKADNPNWKTAMEVEQNCQFEAHQKGKSVVQGKIDESNPNIYFRVGLKGKIPSTEVRYGLISLIHSEGNHLIYVRQGEALDYIMNENDPYSEDSYVNPSPPYDYPFYGYSPGSSTRPNVVKVSPYSLTVTKALTPGTSYAENLVESDIKTTGYPSKGGFLFYGPGTNNNRAFSPYGPVSNNLSGTATIDLCPRNSRLPNDNGVDGSGNSSPGRIAGSEVRQSFWLTPKDAFKRSTFNNMLRGYIADGYYDRRRMRFPNYATAATRPEISSPYTRTNSNGNKDGAQTYQVSRIYNNQGKEVESYWVPTIVDEMEGVDMAFAGMLVYNPKTYASVFLPSMGGRTQMMNFANQGMGSGSDFWTSTRLNNSNYSYLSSGFAPSSGATFENDFFIFDMYSNSANYTTAMSIRCVSP